MSLVYQVFAPLALALLSSLAACGGGDAESLPAIEIVPASNPVSDPYPKARLRFNADQVVGFLGEPKDLQGADEVCWVSEIRTPAQGGQSCGRIVRTAHGLLEASITLYQTTDVGTFVLFFGGVPSYGMSVERWDLPRGFSPQIGFRGRPYLVINL